MDYKYRLVVFTESKKEQEVIDIVPTSWFYFDNDEEVLRCKFMPLKNNKENYDTEELALLTRMIENCDDPLPEWPLFIVEVRGRAKTYEEATLKVTILEKKPYAFSTDNEVKAKEKAQQDEKHLKLKTISMKNKISEDINDVMIDLDQDIEDEGLDSLMLSAQKQPSILNSGNSNNFKASYTKSKTFKAKKSSSNKISDNSSSSNEEERASIKSKSSILLSKNTLNKGAARKTQTTEKERKRTLQTKKSSPKSISDSSCSSNEEEKVSTKSSVLLSKNKLNKRAEQKTQTTEKERKRTLQTKKSSPKSISDSSCSSNEERASTKSKSSVLYSKNLTNKKAAGKTQTIEKERKRTLQTKELSLKITSDSSCSSNEQEKVSTKLSVLCSKNTSNKDAALKFRTDQEYKAEKSTSAKHSEYQLLDMLENFFEKFLKTQREMQAQIIDLSLAVQDVKDTIIHHDFQNIETTEDDQCILPYCNLEAFIEFNNRLSNDQQFRVKQMKQFVMAANRKSGLTRSIGYILRMYLTRDLAQQFTTTKAVKGKKVLKDYPFYKYLKEALSRIFKEDDGETLTDTTFKSAVKSILSNVKDWDGQGSVRKQASKK